MKTGIFLGICLSLFLFTNVCYGNGILGIIENGPAFQENNQDDFTDTAKRLRADAGESNAIALGVLKLQPSKSGTFVLLISGIVLAAVVAGFNFNRKKRGSRASGENAKVLNDRILSFPDAIYFDKSHTWVSKEKDGTLKMGIDDFLQHVTGDYTGLWMKNPEESFVRHEPVLSLLQKGKRINVKAPVSGKIKEFNKDLLAFPAIVNNSPYSWGWIYIIEPTSWVHEINLLMLAKSYKTWIKKEIARLKDFVSAINPDAGVSGQVVYQEGGELPDNVLEDFDLGVWEEFQKRFLDTADLN